MSAVHGPMINTWAIDALSPPVTVHHPESRGIVKLRHTLAQNLSMLARRDHDLANMQCGSLVTIASPDIAEMSTEESILSLDLS